MSRAVGHHLFTTVLLKNELRGPGAPQKRVSRGSAEEHHSTEQKKRINGKKHIKFIVIYYKAETNYNKILEI